MFKVGDIVEYYDASMRATGEYSRIVGVDDAGTACMCEIVRPVFMNSNMHLHLQWASNYPQIRHAVLTAFDRLIYDID